MKRVIGILIILLTFLMASPPALLADDTEVYGSVQISVKPNVLIIFDTSGSMGTADIPSEPYDSGTDYSSYGSYGKNTVYKKDKSGWKWFASHIDDIGCQAAQQQMLTRGWTTYRLRGSPTYACRTDTTKERFRIGNYLNFLEMGGVYMRKRTDVAKEVIVDLLNSVDNVNFGLFRFNYEHGGRLVKPIGTSKAEMIAAVNALPANGWTPLAETLAEAGLYFAGKKSWYNEGNGDEKDLAGPGRVDYKDLMPMEYACQKNYIILMTDGYSTRDKSDALWKPCEPKFKYILGDCLGGDLDADKNDCTSYTSGTCDGAKVDGSDGTDFLDDVAKYLYDNDINTGLGAVGDPFEKQNLTVFTIGFQTDFQLLADTAANGGGDYYTAGKAEDLAEAFESIMSHIIDENAVFVAPVVPVNRMNRAFAGDFLYLGFFRPKADGNWSGNLKKFGIDSNGEMVDKTGAPATDSTGRIVLEASSYWSTTTDGPDVETGGAGEALSSRTGNRDLYTYIENPSVAPAVANLTDAKNAFVDSNSEITDALLGNPAEGKTAVINRVHGTDRAWDLSDILHSEPKVLHYWETDDGDHIPEDGEILSYIFVGANDGMLHAFKDSNGKEEWGFIPPDQLDRLKLMLDSDTNHDYFVDGSPVAYERWDASLDDTDFDTYEDPGEGLKILFFGERRGGEYYNALDVSDALAPSFLYSIGPLHLSDIDNDGIADLSGADLGQSWIKPEVRTLFWENNPNLADDHATADVFLMAGGYDTNQDLLAGEGLDETGDAVGRAVFAIEVETGNLVDLNNDTKDDLNFNGYNSTADIGMTHSIIDISGFDTDGNGYMNAVYAGDLGGHLFAFRDSEPGKKNPSNNNWPYAYDGVWEKRKLFEISPKTYDHDGDNGAATPALNLGLKFMYSPDAVRELFDGSPGEYIYIGTGDRTHPANTDFTDALYAIKNPWEDLATFTTLSINNLYDATDNLIQDAVGATAEETKTLREAEKTKLDVKDGWFILLENSGEKIVSTPRVFAGVVYFTTYEPPSAAPPQNDPCVVPTARGTARLYAVDYKTGGASHQFDQSNTELNKSDRSVIIGTSVPSAPVIAVHESGAKIFVGVQGGVKSLSPTATAEINMYYWRQLF